jgi:hypothetical protein
VRRVDHPPRAHAPRPWSASHRNPATLVTPTGSILRAKFIPSRQINTSSRERNERRAPEERSQKRWST